MDYYRKYWHTSKTKLQANVLGSTPVFFPDTFDTACFTTPCLSTDVPRLVLFQCTMPSIIYGLCNKNANMEVSDGSHSQITHLFKLHTERN